jgi:hypothetical protein
MAISFNLVLISAMTRLSPACRQARSPKSGRIHAQPQAKHLCFKQNKNPAQSGNKIFGKKQKTVDISKKIFYILQNVKDIIGSSDFSACCELFFLPAISRFSRDTTG